MLIKSQQITLKMSVAKCQPFCPGFVDLIHNSLNAPVSYPTMHHFVTGMYTCVHISATN